MSGDISGRLKGCAGQRYDSAYPPFREFPNSPSGEHFKDFVQATLQESPSRIFHLLGALLVGCSLHTW